MYSGKIAVPPGGGGIVRNKQLGRFARNVETSDGHLIRDNQQEMQTQCKSSIVHREPVASHPTIFADANATNFHSFPVRAI
jgi:hypothetical protein